MNYHFKVRQQNLDSDQSSILSSFLLELLNKPFSKLIYRGESIINLQNKLNIQPDENVIDRLNHFIFKIGDKGRVYQREYSDGLKERSLFSIDENSERFYRYIFKKINNILVNSLDPEIDKFKSQNIDFTSYFLNLKNSPHFVSSMSALSSSEQLIKRDYYLNFLHRVGRLGFYFNTFMLSTTTNKSIAEQFTTEDDIIFVSWQLKDTHPFERVGEKCVLPKYKTNIFSYQNEITKKGGLFPQHILGFIERSTNFFHVNPNLFYYSELINYMISNGIPIDQSDFEEIRAKTNYTGSFHKKGSIFTDTINNDIDKQTDS